MLRQITPFGDVRRRAVGTPLTNYGIDRIDPAYYTAGDGDGQETTACGAGVDVARDPGYAAQCCASVLRAIESDPGRARFRRLRRRPVPAVLRRRRPAGAAAWTLLP